VTIQLSASGRIHGNALSIFTSIRYLRISDILILLDILIQCKLQVKLSNCESIRTSHVKFISVRTSDTTLPARLKRRTFSSRGQGTWQCHVVWLTPPLSGYSLSIEALSFLPGLASISPNLLYLEIRWFQHYHRTTVPRDMTLMLYPKCDLFPCYSVKRKCRQTSFLIPAPWISSLWELQRRWLLKNWHR